MSNVTNSRRTYSGVDSSLSYAVIHYYGSDEFYFQSTDYNLGDAIRAAKNWDSSQPGNYSKVEWMESTLSYDSSGGKQ